MTETLPEFVDDEKEAAKKARRFKMNGLRTNQAVRKAVDYVAGDKSEEYRRDLFTVVKAQL